MEQTKRDKIAWVSAVVLSPILIYLLAVYVFKVGGTKPPSTPPALAASGELAPIKIGSDAAPSSSAGAQVPSYASPPALGPNVVAEQRKIAARLPRRNPFSAVQADYSLPAARTEAILPVNNDNNIKVTAIVSRPGSNKRIAMIGGKMLEEGDRIGEWTILRVNPKNVVLGNGAQQMVVGVK